MKTIKRIYLDNNASTAVDPQVLEIFISEIADGAGNPSSIHSFGQASRNRLNKSRRIIADYLKAKPHEIIFNSGGTEGANMLIRGFFADQPSGHILTSNVEHSCVEATIKMLEASGCQATYLPAGLEGAVTPDAVRKALRLRPDTRLITLMAVNNETGAKTDIAAIAQIALEAGVPFFVDGVALLGKEPIVLHPGISAMWFSGHKLHAPKGVGFAFIRSNLKLKPLIIGGTQEYGRRGGTENLPGIVAMAAAVELLHKELPAATVRMESLRNKLEQTLMAKIPDTVINGTAPRVVNMTNLAFPGVEGESLLTALDLEGLAVSHGSACSSGALEPSRVLRNMGIPDDVAGSSIRFSLSRFTTEQEIDDTIAMVVKVVGKLNSK